MQHQWFTLSIRSVFRFLPLATGITSWQLWKSLWSPRDAGPLIWAVILFVLAFSGLAVSIYPYIVPYRYTLFEAANDPASLRFASFGVAVVLPITVAYLLLGYRVFRGKVRARHTTPLDLPHVGAQRGSGNPPDLHMS